MKNLRERCEKLREELHYDFAYPHLSLEGRVDLIEAFAREIRAEALEEAIGLADKMAQFRKGHNEEMDMINAGGTITAGVIAAKLREMKSGANALAANDSGDKNDR